MTPVEEAMFSVAQWFAFGYIAALGFVVLAIVLPKGRG